MTNESGKPWRAYPSRQLTGAPHRHHGYVTRDYEVTPTRVNFIRAERLCHDGYHRSPEAADGCARRAASRLNRVTELSKGSPNGERKETRAKH